MTLKTKLIAATTALTFGVVLCVSGMFLSELLSDRISQTAAANDALVSEVLLSARHAIESGIRAHPPANSSDAAFRDATADALRSSAPLLDLMNSIVRYSPTVQDVSIMDSSGITLVSTDPTAFNQPLPERTTFAHLMDQGILVQTRMVFGDPRVLDIGRQLDRYGAPLIFVHLGIRSTFLSNSYGPWLRSAIVVILFALLAAVIAAAFLTSIALRPLGLISQQIDSLTVWSGREDRELGPGKDAVLNVSRKIDVLGRRIRTSQQEFSALQTNLNQMLDTLRDCVVLFSGDRRAILVSESTADLLHQPMAQVVGHTAGEIFDPSTELGKAIAAAFARAGSTREERVTLESGRRISFSLESIEDSSVDDAGRKDLGALLILRDVETVEQFERELDLSRRLAAIGRLTSGVGHEVKNPINSMVLHLELLKGKLDAQSDKDANRHLDVLTREMSRLDRVVQTLADFSRPIELHLVERDLRATLASVLALAAVQIEESRVTLEVHQPNDPIPVHIDAELLQQAILNIILNGLQAMPQEMLDAHAGKLRITLRAEADSAELSIQDNGSGISADVLPSIFNLYFTTKPRGSGIGLAMVYRILQMHGGAVEVASDAQADSPTRGTTFILRVPLSHRAALPNSNRQIALESITS